MSRTVGLSVLDSISVASPCRADWERMAGDDRVRFCGECRLHVYNLSAMSREEAEALVIDKEGNLCAMFYRRADGTVLTRDCPVGLRAARARLAAGLARIGAAAACLLASAATLGMARFPGVMRLRRVQPFATICEWIKPAPPPVPCVPGRITVTTGVTILPTQVGLPHTPPGWPSR